jgi:hypothetical protein
MLRQFTKPFSSIAPTLILAILAGCGLLTPVPQKGEYLQTGGGGFLYDRETQQVQYGIVVIPRKPIPAGSMLEATFEDPVGNHPFTISTTVKLDEKDFTLKSPPVHGTRAGTNYRIQIRLYSDTAKSLLLDAYTQDVRALMDQSQLGWP